MRCLDACGCQLSPWTSIPGVAPQAAQALEPAALIPLPLLAPAGRAVLVGDPAQLPATVLSKAAAAANLAQSLFERLQRVRARNRLHRADQPRSSYVPRRVEALTAARAC